MPHLKTMRGPDVVVVNVEVAEEVQQRSKYLIAKLWPSSMCLGIPEAPATSTSTEDIRPYANITLTPKANIAIVITLEPSKHLSKPTLQ